jgi:hypothetical protein
MASSIQLLRSNNAQERPFPGNLLDGQPAINTNEQEPGLFFKANDGTLIKIGPAAVTSDGNPPNFVATGQPGNSVGELWLDKSVPIPVLKVYDGVQWVDAGSGGGGSSGVVTLQRWVKTAAGGETSLSGPDNTTQILSYTPGLEEVFLNGVLLTRDVDYFASSGTSITSLSPLTAGDEVTVLGWTPFNVLGAIDGSQITDESISGAKLASGLITDALTATDAAIQSSKLAFERTGSLVTKSIQQKLEEEVNLLDFIPTGTNTAAVDCSSFISAAVSQVGPQKTLVIPKGTYLIQSPVNLRFISLSAEDASILVDHPGIGVFMGGNAGSSSNPRQSIFSVQRVVQDLSTPTVRIVGAKGQWISIQRSEYVQVYADTDPVTGGSQDSSSAYSTFNLRFVSKLELANNESTTGSTIQWINENNFFLNRINTLEIKGTYSHNHNMFLRGAFENGNINISNGSQNQILDARAEGGLNVVFSANAANNLVTYGWQSSGNNYNFVEATVTDGGNMNSVQHVYDTHCPMEFVVAFDQQTLKQSGGKYNVSGVSNVAISPTDLSVPAFQTFFESPIIPASPNGDVFYSQVKGMTVGGMRTIVIGYDASGSLISSTGDDLVTPGQGDTGFGEAFPGSSLGSAGISRFYVKNPDVAFIKVTVEAGGNGIVFGEGYFLSVRHSNRQIFRATQKSSYFSLNNI